MILPCKCKHDQQDKMYGKRKRVMNLTKKTNGTKAVYRCTVCSAERTE